MNTQSNVIPIQDETPEAPARDPYSHVEALKAFQKAQQLTWAEIARRLDYDASTLSLYRNRKYAGDVHKLNDRVGKLLEAERTYELLLPRVQHTVITHQVDEVMGAIDYLEHSAFGLFVGEAGIGKTQGVREYARRNIDMALLITLDPLKRSQYAFVKHLFAKIPGNPRKRLSTSEQLDEIIRYFNKRRKTLLIDEAHFMNMNALETARSIQDQTGIGIVLSGTFLLDEEMGFAGSIPKNAQLYSRVRIHRVISPTVRQHDLAEVLEQYKIFDAGSVDWLFERCNRPGRRYRWCDSIVRAAYQLCKKQNRPLTFETIRQAEKLTGLY